jgi:flavin reductase (DIM6/NTAB) family NADH-FMN oxidoreductase RutF
MFFETAHGMRPAPLARDPFKALVVPRPIGWVTTLDRGGAVNLAPFSFFNAVGSDPPCVMFCPNDRADGKGKDSRLNAEETGEFVCSLATWDLREQMRLTSTSVPRGVNEMELAGLTPAPSVLVKPPRVEESPAALECAYVQTVALPPGKGKARDHVVIGRVVGIYIRDDVIVDGLVDVTRMKPIARLGYSDYAVVDRLFSMPFPD